MKTYLVRLIGAENPCGLATADDMLDLWLNVEDVCKPLCCEFLEVTGTGAVMVSEGELDVSEEYEFRLLPAEDDPLIRQWRSFIDMVGGEDAFTKWHSENYGRRPASAAN